MFSGRTIIIAGIAALAAALIAFGPAPKRDGDGNTLRIVSFAGPDSIDPGVSWQGLSWQMQVNVYNGLLTFRKVTGPAGTDLVPDLAEAMPVIEDGGRTLRFKVRKGIQFGEPVNREVLPSDLKYSYDRLAKLPSQGAQFFSVIEGFDEVMKSRKGSVAGVVADDDARTITFHLKRPDATFLYVLALPFTYAVPKGTALEDLSQKVRTPATGPYAFTSYDPSRGVTLKRNPVFKVWNEDATPKGEVDRIDIKFKVSDENAITLITQGKADASLTAIPRSKLPFLLSSKEWAPYMHEHEMARISYIWMNTQVAPFDNVKVRKAVNWAINRRAFVKLGGGNGTPTSQILPPTTPGHTGYDPYPEADLAKARELIKESGITPGKVTIWCMTTPPSPDSAQYLQEVLAQLGFEAKTRCLDFSAYYAVVGVKKNKTQIGFGGWGADYPEGSSFIDSNLNGAHIDPNHSSNLAWYTGQDKEIARVMGMMDLKARAKAWGELDRKIVEEDSAWAPYMHGVNRNLVGKRVGNYTFHPLFDLLYSKVTVNGSGTNNKDTHNHEVGYDADGKPVADDEEGAGS
ncbi:MAG: ABC transporter substrate-binding protein [Gaiellales bacterium]